MKVGLLFHKVRNTTAAMVLCLLWPGINSGICQTNIQSNIKFTQWGLDHGLSQVTCNDVLQANSGFIWVGTQDGLNRFDGNAFKVYRQNSSSSGSLSNSYITSLIEDREYQLWIGTLGNGINKYIPDTDNFKTYLLDERTGERSANHINTFSIDRSGKLWAGSNKGLYFYDKHSDSFQKWISASDIENAAILAIAIVNEQLWLGTEHGIYIINPKNNTISQPYKKLAKYSNTSILSLLFDSSQNLWIGTKEGVGKFNIALNALSNFNNDTLSDNYIRTIFEDSNGNVWVGTDYGLNIYNTQSNNFTSIFKNSNLKSTLTDNDIRSMAEDEAGNVLIGTDNGLCIYDPLTSKFQHYTKGTSIPLNNEVVYEIFQDSNNLLWIGTDGDGLNQYNPNSKQMNYFKHDPDKVGSISGDVIWDVMEDSEGQLWVATNNGINVFDPISSTFSNKTPGIHHETRCVFEDSKNNFWIGTSGGGLYSIDKSTNTITQYIHKADNNKSISSNFIRSIYEDSDGNLWVGTYGGGLNHFNYQDSTFSHYIHDPDAANSLSNNIIYCIYEDTNSSLWIGTSRGLNRFNKTEKTFEQWTIAEGLSNDVIYGILEDVKGNLWMSTNSGINKFNPATGKFIAFDKLDGLQDYEFNVGAYFKDNDGNMYFGGINGFNVFHPDSVVQNKYMPRVLVTDFLLFNKSVSFADSSVLSKPIELTNKITLSHDDYIFAFEFFALNFRQQQKNSYAYKLSGFNDDWIYTNANDRKAVFTNVPHGRYIFKVKAANDDGLWNENPTEIIITILPPWWLTWWAKAGVGMLIIAGIGLVFSIRIFELNRQKKLLEKEVKERTNEVLHQKNELEKAYENVVDLNREKTGMMSIVAHDLKSPLNNILSFIELMKLEGNLNKDQLDYLEKMENITQHGRTLIRDLVDIHSIEGHSNELEISSVLIPDFIQSNVEDFSQQLKKKQQKITVSSEPKQFNIQTNDTYLSRILSNLLSNAIKFSPLQAEIEVQAWLSNETVEIKVMDKGPGIAEEEKLKLFKPFQRLSAQPTGGETSTGLGLSITKALVQKLGGDITIDSTPGGGSTFVVQLPASLS